MTRLPARRSEAWSIVFRVSYRLIRVVDPLVRSWVANGLPGLAGVVEVRTVGRRTDRLRRIPLTILRVGDAWYLGHPDGDAAWIRNALAAGWVDVDPPARSGPRHRVTRLDPGAERDAVIRATWTQQPFPANLLYRLARRHVAAAGVFLRLHPVEPDHTGHDAGPPLAADPGEAAADPGDAAADTVPPRDLGDAAADPGDAAPHEPAPPATDEAPPG